MGDLDRRIEGALAGLREELDRRSTPDPPRLVRPHWQRVALAVAGVGIAVAAMIWVTGNLDAPGVGEGSTPIPPIAPSTTVSPPTTIATPTTSPPEASVPPSGPTFGQETGVVFLFDDGGTGLIAVDPDRRMVQRHGIVGQRAGDEPFSMVRIGDHLVVGWGAPYAVDMATLEGTSLGSALIFLPGSEDDRVWMINDPWGDDTTAWQVDLYGNPTTDIFSVAPAGSPVIGIPGGLALSHDRGLSLWDAASGDTRDVDAADYGRVLTTTPKELIWCSGECHELLITNLETLETERFQPPDGYESFTGPLAGWRAAPTSPEGVIAALVGSSASPEGQAIWLLDRTSGAETVVRVLGYGVSYLAWAPDGGQLFASRWSYQESNTVIWRYDLATGTVTSVALPVGGALTLVVIDSSEAGVFFGDSHCPSSPQGQLQFFCFSEY